MATTIINPAQSNSSSSWMPFMIGVIALIVLAALFIFFVIPYIRGFSGTGGIQVNVPKSIDVKVQQNK